jgi:LysM repeat protein
MGSPRATSQAPAASARHYVVKPGDNIWTIAREHGVSFAELKQANKQLEDRRPPYGVNPGDKILIPSKLPPISKSARPAAAVQPCLQCRVDSGELRCGHGARNYKLKWAPATSKGLVLQVIASQKAEEVCTIVAQGTCDNGRKDCPAIRVRGNGRTQEGKQRLAASITLPQADFVESYAYFFDHVFLPNARPTRYDVLAVRCDGAETRVAVIEAFPKVEWSGELSVGFSHETHEDSNFNRNQGYSKLKVNGQWKIEGSIKISCDERSWTLGLPSVKTTTGHYKDNKIDAALFRGIQGFLDKVTPVFTSLIDTFGKSSAYGKIDIGWPKLKVSGKICNEEKEKDARVRCAGEVTFALDPLLSLGVKIDILNWIIIYFSAGIGKFLVDLKTRAAEGVGTSWAGVKAEISIMLEVRGEIKGSLTWQANDEGWKTSGEVGIEIPVSIEGKAAAEFRVFVFKAGAGVKAGAKTSIGAKLKAEPGERGPALGGQLYFGGIKVYYTYYYEVGGATMHTTVPKPKPKPGTKLDPSDLSLKDEYERSEMLVEPAAWPPEPALTSLAGS